MRSAADFWSSPRPLSAFDHPVPSLFAVGLARALDVPVTVAVEASDDDRYEALIACSWTARADAESGAAQT